MSIPVYERIILPQARKITKTEAGITNLQRIGVGFFLGIVTMVISGLVEYQRRHIAITQPTLEFERGKGEISAMSGYWLIPQFAIAGISEGFIVIGQSEFYMKQFPAHMKSFVGAFLFCGIGVGNCLNAVLATLIHKTTANWLVPDLNKGRLDLYYYLIAIIQLFNLCYFLVCAKCYQDKREDSTDLEEGENNDVNQTERQLL